FERASVTLFFGYVFDPLELHKRFVVEILLDGVGIELLRAEQYYPELRSRGFGDGCYAFELPAKPAWLERHHVIEARVANTGEPLGDAVLLSASPSDNGAQAPIGAVSWTGGIRLAGWVRDDTIREPAVRAFEGDILLADIRPDRWAHIDSEDKILAGRIGFELWLPEVFADGQVHRIRVTNYSGLDLAGSPVTIRAFRDGLQSFLTGSELGSSDSIRVKLLEDLMPMSLPFS